MEHDDREAMKLDNQLCFPLYAVSRHVISLYKEQYKMKTVYDFTVKDMQGSAAARFEPAADMADARAAAAAEQERQA